MKKYLPAVVGSVITLTSFYLFTRYYVTSGAEQFNDPNYSILMSVLAVGFSIYIVLLSFFLMKE